MECSRCQSQKVFASRRGNAALFFPLRLFLICLRCHHCGQKFYRRTRFLGGKRVRYASFSAT